MPALTTFERRLGFRLLPALVVGVVGWVAMWQVLTLLGDVSPSDAERWPLVTGVVLALVAYVVLTVRVAMPQRLEVSATGLRLVARGRAWSMPWDDVHRLGLARDEGLVKLRPAAGARLPHLSRLSTYPRWEADRGIVAFVPARGWDAPDDVVLSTLRAHAGARWRD